MERPSTNSIYVLCTVPTLICFSSVAVFSDIEVPGLITDADALLMEGLELKQPILSSPSVSITASILFIIYPHNCRIVSNHEEVEEQNPLHTKFQTVLLSAVTLPCFRNSCSAYQDLSHLCNLLKGLSLVNKPSVQLNWLLCQSFFILFHGHKVYSHVRKKKASHVSSPFRFLHSNLVIGSNLSRAFPAPNKTFSWPKKDWKST